MVSRKGLFSASRKAAKNAKKKRVLSLSKRTPSRKERKEETGAELVEAARKAAKAFFVSRKAAKNAKKKRVLSLSKRTRRRKVRKEETGAELVEAHAKAQRTPRRGSVGILVSGSTSTLLRQALN